MTLQTALGALLQLPTPRLRRVVCLFFSCVSKVVSFAFRCSRGSTCLNKTYPCYSLVSRNAFFILCNAFTFLSVSGFVFLILLSFAVAYVTLVSCLKRNEANPNGDTNIMTFVQINLTETGVLGKSSQELLSSYKA